jgi:hypothetical protein
LKELLKVKITQSDSIKLGKLLEDSINSYIITRGGENRKESNSRITIHGENIETDILFLKGSCIYYLEVKSNINLDTEKSKATKSKLDNVVNALKERNPSYNVCGKILSLRYARASDALFYKQPIEREDLMGYSEFFEIFSEDMTRKRWENMMEIVGKIFEKTIEINQ